MSASEQPAPATPLAVTCHCGRVRVTMPSKPTRINACQCTVCYKYGAMWGYFTRKDVKIDVTAPDGTIAKYLRSDLGVDADLSFNRCGHCGCLLFWCGEGKWSGEEEKLGVNCRLVLPKEDIEGIEVYYGNPVRDVPGGS